MSDTSVDDEWSTPTHYTGGKPIEPRALSLGGDPMTTMFPADWGGEHEERWSATTYVGKPRGRKRTPAPEPAPAPAVAVDDAVAPPVEPAVVNTSADTAVLTIVAAVLLTVVFAALSNALALLTRQQETLIGVSQLLGLPLTFLSSAIMDPALMPDWIQNVARYNPLNLQILVTHEMTHVATRSLGEAVVRDLAAI